MKVALAGGSGFVGRHVVAALQARGHDVLVVGRGAQPAPGGAALLAWDLARAGPAPVGELAACQAVVNLAGIKREAGSQTFEAVHVEGTRRLLDAARQAGIERFVHLSVVCSRPDAKSPYHDTKWRAEELVRASGLDFTILKPGVIYGAGDDMVTHLVKMVRFAPVFPIVGRGDSLLQPVDVRDVAEAVALSLARPAAIGKTYDVVGPRRLRLEDVVRTVAEGTGQRLAVLPVPVAVQRVAVRIMDATSSRPLSTPAQLQMLIDGLVGDPTPARLDLGLDPRPFDAASIARLSPAIPPLFGFSLRPWLGPLALTVGATLLIAGLGRVIPNLWLRLGAAYLVLIPAAVWTAGVRWKDLCRPAARHLLLGVAAASALYLGTIAVLAAVPSLATAISSVVVWKASLPPALVAPLLLFIVAGEEIVWRGAVTLGLAAPVGPWPAVLAGALAFGVVHLPLGIGPVVMAALGLGAFWGAMAVKTRSLVPAFLCHLLWDLAVLVRMPG